MESRKRTTRQGSARVDSKMSIKFKPNATKAVEVILWFATERPGVDFQTILTLLFFADVETTIPPAYPRSMA